jgi:hypothetical protein
LRDHFPELQALEADVVVIGTGDLRYAQAFSRDERIPFPVLVDDEGLAAAAASVERVGIARLFAWGSLPATARALRAGHRIGRPGRRVNQLGATFVLAPGESHPAGSRVLFQHHDAHPADHAPMSAIFDALRRCEPLA